MICCFRYQPPIDTLQELADSGLIWAAQDEAFVFLLENTGDPVLERIASHFRIYDPEKLARAAVKAEIGFVMEKLSGGQ